MANLYQVPQTILDQMIEFISTTGNAGAWDIYEHIEAQVQEYEENPNSSQWVHGPPGSLELWAGWAVSTALQNGCPIGNILTGALDVLMSGYWGPNQRAGGESKKRKSKKRKSKKRKSKKRKSKKRK